MNRRERRARVTTRRIAARKIDSICDIQIDAKGEQIVMIFANPKGRKVVEDRWPDVEWTTDEIFSSMHSPDWLFTHIRVTKLPPEFEERTPLAFCEPDALGFAVACALRRHTEPRRVAWYTGQGAECKVQFFGDRAADFGPFPLFAEHVPAGTYRFGGAPESVN
jgi:hypothetical protein